MIVTAAHRDLAEEQVRCDVVARDKQQRPAGRGRSACSALSEPRRCLRLAVRPQPSSDRSMVADTVPDGQVAVLPAARSQRVPRLRPELPRTTRASRQSSSRGNARPAPQVGQQGLDQCGDRAAAAASPAAYGVRVGASGCSGAAAQRANQLRGHLLPAAAFTEGGEFVGPAGHPGGGAGGEEAGTYSANCPASTAASSSRELAESAESAAAQSMRSWWAGSASTCSAQPSSISGEAT